MYIYIQIYKCLPCFPDNRGRFGATGSTLSNGMREFVKESRILISPEPVSHMNMSVLSQSPTHIQYILKYKIHTYRYSHMSTRILFVCVSTTYLI